MNEILKMKPDEKQCPHFGVVDIAVHYTLGAGLAEQLGENVEQAVLRAASSIGGSHNKFLFEGKMIRMEEFWHWHHDKGTQAKQPSHILSLHLSNDREENNSFSVDWDYF
jgi:hypothetical protein